MVKSKIKYSTPTVNANKQFAQVLLVALCLLISSIAQAANITVKTSRNPVALDDSFHLTYEADSSVDDDPDFSPIYKDFDVLSSSQSTNMRSINGSWNLKKTWDLTVIAKAIGKFTVPSISFGNDASPAIKLTVKNSSSLNSISPDGQATIPAKIFLESTINRHTGWVQSQYIYSVKLLRTVSIANASLTELTTSDADAIIHQLSEDNYQTTRNGIRYEVFERRYAIFPQKSGTIKINPITFNGRINATQARSLFDQFRISGQPKRLHSKPINIKVKATPSNINLQDWLPAKEVKLIAEWSGDIENITAGEPVTRTIMIAAEGLTSVQLPDLQFADIVDLKQYPDKAITEDKKSANGIIGYKQIKVALIPARTGKFTLPEIKLHWWNTQTNKAEVAIIPSAHLNVTGSAISNTIISPPENEISAPLNLQPAIINDIKTTVAAKPYWKWLSAFFALAWLITLSFYFRKPKFIDTRKHEKTKQTTLPIKTAIANVEKSAKKNDANNTKSALTKWAVVIYDNPNITNLSQICEYCSPQLKPLIRQLNKTLYSTEEKTWNGKALLQAFKDEQKLPTKKNNKQSSTLKPLYNQ